MVEEKKSDKWYFASKNRWAQRTRQWNENGVQFQKNSKLPNSVVV